MLCVSINVDWLFLLQIEINDDLFGIISRRMSPFSGNAPEMIALYA